MRKQSCEPLFVGALPAMNSQLSRGSGCVHFFSILIELKCPHFLERLTIEDENVETGHRATGIDLQPHQR